ncbi:MAG: choice-of-anchor D domain-containing protein [Cystobacter sp.]
MSYATDVDKSSVGFGSVRAGETVTEDVVVRNAGKGTLKFSLALTGNAAFSLAIAAPSTLPISLEPGESKTLTVSYLASELDAEDGLEVNAQLDLQVEDDPTFPSTPITVTGTSIKPKLVLSKPEGFAFGLVRAGTAADQEIVVSNEGTGPLTVDSIGSPTDTAFVILQKPPNGTVLAPKASPADPASSMTLQVRFTAPTSATVETTALPRSGTIAVVNTDRTFKDFTVGLSGTAVKPKLVLSTPGGIAFGLVRAETSVEQDLVVTNEGTGPFKLAAISAPSNNAFVILQQPAAGTVLAPKRNPVDPASSMTLRVRFTAPTSATVDTTPIPRSSSISLVNTDSSSDTVPVALSGTAVKPKLVLSTPGGIAFGAVRASTSKEQELVVTNEGTGPFTVDSIGTPTNDAFVILQKPAAGTVLAPKSDPANPASSMTLRVRFDAPTSANVDTVPIARSGTIALANKDESFQDYTVAVSGTAVKPKLKLTPATGFAFGTLRAGTSAEQNVTVSNEGTGPLTLDSVGTPTDPTFTIVQKPANGTVLKPKANPADAASSTTIRVRFDAPTAEPLSPRSGTIALANKDGDHSNFTIPVSGSPVAPKLVMSVVGVVGSVLDFKDQRVGSNTEMELTLSNEGNGPIVLTSIGAPTHTAFTLIQKPPDNIELKPMGEVGSSTKFRVNFLAPPDTGAPVVGSIVLSNEDPTYKNKLKIDLRGRGVNPIISYNPKLEFGEVRAGGAGETKTIKINNTGSGSAFFYDVSVSGDSSFSLEPAIPRNTPFEVPPGGRTLTVRFRPLETSSDLRTGWLRLFTSESGVDHIAVALEGSSVAPSLQVNADKLDFGRKNVGSAVTTLRVPVRNMGSGKLHFSGITTSVPSGSNPFSVSPKDNFDLLSSQGEQHFTVSFNPSTLGNFEGSLVFQTNDPAHETVTVPLSGRAQKLLTVHAKGEPSSQTLSFEDVRLSTFVERTFTVTNDGSSTIELSGLQFSNSQFTSPQTFNVQLSPSRPSVDIKVTFTPTATGEFNESVTLVSNADNAPQPKITLLGKGTQSKIKLYLASNKDAREINFGDVAVNTRSSTVELTVENPGDASLKLTSVSVIDSNASPSPFNASNPTSMDVAAGGTVKLPVYFLPRDNGDFVAKVEVVSDAVEGDVQFDLIGRGQSANITLPVKIVFPSTRLNQKSAPFAFTIGNSGKSRLEINRLDLPPGFVLVDPKEPPSTSSPWTIEGPTGVKPVQLAFEPLWPTTPLGDVSLPLKIYSNATNAVGGFSSVTLEGRSTDGIREILTPAGEPELVFEATDARSSRTRTVRISNSGESPLTVRSAVATSNSTPNPFSVINFTTNSILSPKGGNVLEFQVQFKPEYHGPESGMLSLDTDSVSQGAVSLSLTGFGNGAHASLVEMDETLDFGAVNVRSVSSRNLRVTNVGELALNINKVTFTREPTDGGTTGTDDTAQVFTVDRYSDGGSPLPVTVASGTAVSIPLKFQPTLEGQRNARLSVVSNARDVSMPARGQGTVPQLSVTPVEGLVFRGVQLGGTSQPQEVTITNTGSGALSIKTIALSEDVDVFLLQHPELNGSYPLEPGDSMSVAVRFKPSATRESAVIQLVVTTVGDRPLIKSINLDGRGTSEPLSVDSRVEFGRQLTGTPSSRTVRISNGLAEAITFVKATMRAGNGCSQFKPDPEQNKGFTVEGLQEAELTVNFTPSSVGALPAPCTMVLDFGMGQSGNKEVELTGEGVDATISVSRATVDFGSVMAGSERRTEGFYIRNELSNDVILAVEESPGSTGERFSVDLKVLNGLSLGPQESHYVSVGYQPMTDTASATRLMLGTSLPSKLRALEVNLKGEAKTKVLSASRSSFDFGQVDVSKISESEDIIITNGASQAHRVLVSVKKADSSAFHVGANEVVRTYDLGPKGTDTSTAVFRVKFSPKAVGAVDDEVQIKLQDSTTADVVIAVNGVGRILTGHGMGCSAAGAEWGGLSLLALLGMRGLRAWRRRRE